MTCRQYNGILKIMGITRWPVAKYFIMDLLADSPGQSINRSGEKKAHVLERQ
jgi:hypothetical protein